MSSPDPHPHPFADLQAAARRLRSGGIVAFPTETVYGLGADAFQPAAIERIYELKGRPLHNPLIVHVSGPEMARRVARQWPLAAEQLARRFWPGPLSILVPRSPDLPPIVTAGSDLVAVRCPNHPVALALLFELGSALVGPSANLSGQVSPTTAEHVREAFPSEQVMVLDGGPCEGGIESTVVDVMSDPVRILRPGLIGPEQIAATIGREVVFGVRTASTEPAEPLHSPGLLERHYAPATPAHLFTDADWPRILTGPAHPPIPSAAIITHRLRDVPAPHVLFQMPPDAPGYAAALYAALREADRARAAMILIESPPTDSSLWRAIHDRLSRATTEYPESP